MSQHGAPFGDRTLGLMIRSPMLYHQATALPTLSSGTTSMPVVRVNSIGSVWLSNVILLLNVPGVRITER